MSAQPARDPYGRPYVAPQPVAPAPIARTRPLGLVARILLTVAGAAGLIIGGFMNWIHGMNGVDLSARAFYQRTFVHDGNFVTTAGFAMIVLGLLAVVGLAPRSGWLTRLCGALGIVGFTLFAIQVSRAHMTFPGSIDAGAWVCLAGGVVALIGGFLGTRMVLTAPAATGPTVVE
jgi:hypothetical protein